MRSERSEVKTKGGHDQALVGLRRESARKSANRRLTLEHLEERTLLATLPQPLVPLAATPVRTGLRGNASTPSIAIDKNNPQKLVATYTINDPAQGGDTKVWVEAAYSNNGGQTWSSLSGLGLGSSSVLNDPTTSNPIKNFAQVTSASVAFDRNDNVYILDSQNQGNTGPNAPNALVLYKYDFSGNTPSAVDLAPADNNRVGKVVYQSSQDMALTPMLAVDDNLTSYVDTDYLGQAYVQNDPYVNNVYVAWATNDQPHQNAVNFNPNRILMVASSDGGANFSGPVILNNNGNNGGGGTQRATTPQLSISQGRPANKALYGPGDTGIPGGQVSIIYDDFNSGAGGSPPYDIIWNNRTSGAATQSVNGNVGPIPAATTTTFQTPVFSITNPNFTTLSDLTVSILLAHGSVNDLNITLIAPDGRSIVLTPNGGQAAGGASGANLGIASDGEQAPTIFTDNGVTFRSIGNQASSSPYMGYYRPSGGNLNQIFGGMTAAQIGSGTWKLVINNVNTTTGGTLRSWALNFNSGMSPGQNVEVARTLVRGSMTNQYPLGAAVSGQGIGPGISLASDNTVGAYSPFQGRLYAAYVNRYNLTGNPADNTDIQMMVSDDGGLTWGLPSIPGGVVRAATGAYGQLINDDLAITDGFSEANGGNSGRPQYQPQVQVDAMTGTVVISFLDARNDAARARVTTYVGASIDGGQTYAPQVFANDSQTAIDALSGKTVVLGPVPENQSGGNPATDGTFGFGSRQGLAVYGGKIHPAWSSNQNGGIGVTTQTLGIRTTTISIAAGPRVVESTMGPVGLPGDSVNPSNGGPPTARGFLVRFDRPVDPNSFMPSSVHVYFRGVNGEVELLTTTQVVPLQVGDPNNRNNAFGYTLFQVSFTPSSKVGTYSYYIDPDIHDRIGSASTQLQTIGPAQAFPSTDSSLPLTIPPVVGSATTTVQSSFLVAGFPANAVIDNLTLNLTINYTADQALTLVLISPQDAAGNRTRITLSNQHGVGGQGYINTTFDDSAAIAIGTGNPPYTGSFRPDQALRQLRGLPINGLWTLEVTNNIPGGSGALANWSLSLTPGAVLPVANRGNLMDQDSSSPAGTQPVNSLLTLPSPDPSLPLAIPPVVGPSATTIQSTSTVASFPDTSVVANVTVNVTINYNNDQALTLTLISPPDANGNRTSIVLSNQHGPGGAGYQNTTFDDNATRPISFGNPPYTGTFRPDQLLSQLRGKPINGDWTLQVTNNLPGGTGALVNWTLTLTPGPVAGILGDAYAVPTPTGTTNLNWPVGQYLPAPYDPNTLPLIVPGPHIIGSHVPGAPVTADNLVTNSTVSAIDVTFDRDMDLTSITPASILRVMGPTGPINGPFTIVPVTGSLRTFRISFPAQQLSGTYTVTLASSIKSAQGDALDTNLNAGVDVLRQTPSTPTPALTFPSANVPLAITPQQTITSTLTVPTQFLVQGMTLTLNINHPFDPDLEAVLIAPDGTTSIPLFTNVGTTGGQANFSNTTFDDAAATLIQNGGPPFFGSFKPQQALSAFNGLQAAGTWTLQIKSDTPANVARTGSLLSWSMTFQQSVPSTGLGELVADRANVDFRIFTTDPTNPLSHNSWTPVGPATVTNDAPGNGYSGQIGAIAVDPSDPSGNTVYVAGASGGIWKTNNFLTTDAAGPTYIPLTDFGPTYGMNIGSIDVFARNNDPNQSIIIAGTGFADGTNDASFGNTTRGVGFLRSTDGGASWTLLDSTNNNLPFSATPGQPQRDHLFANVDGGGQGTSTYKVVVDPRPAVNGQVIVYAAMAGLNGGLWRSIDTGQTWQKLSNDATQGTIATDITLDFNSAIPNAVNNPTGNVNIIYVAFQNHGVYISPNRGQSLNLMVGNNFDPLIRDPKYAPAPAIIVANGTFPSNPGRIVLGKPAFLPKTDPNANVLNSIYAGWLYAAVAKPDGSGLLGLYMTKDNGATWTQVHAGNIPQAANSNQVAGPSNNPNNPVYDPLVSKAFPGVANYNIALSVDPTNPNIVYLGGTSVGQDSGLLRIDTTNIFDSHAAVPFDGSRPDGGLTQGRSAGHMQIKLLDNGVPGLFLVNNGFLIPIGTGQYLNLIQDPNNAFQTSTTLYLSNVNSVGSPDNNGGNPGFTNDGSGVTWIPFDGLLNGHPADLAPSTNIHRMITIVDPLTGHARLIIGDDQGVFTGVDNNGTISAGIGTALAPAFSRNGNLQISQFFYGAAQPSSLAAQIAKALAYGNGTHTGIGASDPNVLSNGNTNWLAPSENFISNGTDFRTLQGEISGVGVQTDQQGRGIVYQYLFPGLGGAFTDFFQVSENGAPFISRTTGLIQTNGVSDPQWPTGSVNYGNGLMQGNFTVNPIAGDQVMISSNDGRVFSTIDQGRSWLVIANPGDLDSTYAPALTYGAPDPNGPAGIGNLNNFLYAGTRGGKIFVSTTGGGTSGSGNSWTDISTGLDGSPVLKIIADPTRGNHNAYAITQKGVYYTGNSLATGGTAPVWKSITGNLFTVMNPAFGDPNLADNLTDYLTSIVADWRYVIPTTPTPLNGPPTHPVLYVSGEAGVYRSLDNGQTWSLFPSINFDAAPLEGGALPNVHISDLNLALGDIDPTTGRPVAKPGDPNNLFATTFGRGTFTIRLAPIVFPNTASQPSNISLAPVSSAGTNPAGVPLVDPTTSRPIINGFSEQTAFGNRVLITLYDLTNPNNPVLIGGYDPNVPATDTVANRTDPFGKYSIQVNQNGFNSNGPKTIGIQATDASGTTGNIATFSFILQATNLGLPIPPATPTIGLSPFDDSSNGQKVTNNTQPRIIGMTDQNVDVELFLSVGGNPTGTVLATGRSDINGNFSLRFNAPLTDGPYLVQVKATNQFGSSVSLPFSFTIDTVGPTTTPSIGILAADDTGIIGDGMTSSRRPHFVGTTEPNASVVIFGANNLSVPLGQAVANNLGAYSVQLPSDLQNGKITLVARARDIAGNQGPLGTPFNLTINTVAGDYTGDGRADLSLVFRASQAQWVIGGMTNGTPFGVGTLDIPLQGDFNGDGRSDLATYRPSTAQWFVRSYNGSQYVDLLSNVQYGQAYVDIPVPGDYLGTGMTSIAIYRPTTGEWFIPNSPGGVVQFGGAGDIPVPGDYDGIGRTQLAVYRPKTGQFFIAGHAQPIQVGAPGQIPVPGAYDNSLTSHKVEPAVYDPSTGIMTIMGPNNQVRTVQFTPGSIPVPGDYDNVGSDQPTAFNPTTNTWTIYTPGTNQSRNHTFGGPSGGGVAVAAPYSYRKLPVAGDYTGIGKAQDTLFRRSNPQAQWFIGGVTGPNGIAFGAGSTDIPLLGDFNGDGRSDLAVFRPSTAQWLVQGVFPANGIQFGGANIDIPAPADYYGTGTTTLAVFRPATGQWFVAGDATPFQMGKQGDTPVPADYDGDGRADIAVFEPATSTNPTRWLIRGSATGLQNIVFGGSQDIPVPGDYDGFGRSQIAVFRPGSAQWFIAGHAPVQFGGPTDIPVPADYNGDGKVDIAVYRPSSGQLFIAGVAAPIQFGGPNDIPINAPFIYRSLSNKISATSTLDFGSRAAALSTVAAPSVSAAATVAAPIQTTTATTPTPAPVAPPVAAPGHRRPNQQKGQGNPVKTPANRLRLAQLHDSALASLLGRLGRLGKRRS